MDLDQAIDRIEEGIRRLKQQYDVFFSGATPHPPIELRNEIERLIRQYTNTSMRRYADQFRFNTVVGRFNLYAELWNKQVRAREEGGPRGQVVPPPPPPAARSRRPADDPQTPLVAIRISNPETELEGLRALYESYSRARSEASGAPSKVSMDAFVRKLSDQVNSIKASRGCNSVEFVITSGGSQVQIKARPTRETPEEAVK